MTRHTTRFLAAAALALLACSGAPRIAPVSSSCYSVSFGRWTGPLGPLQVSSAPRVFELTGTPASPAGRAPASPSRSTFLARMLEGDSFGELASLASPIWWPIANAGSLVIAMSDTSRGFTIDLVRSDSGLVGLASATSTSMVRDSTGDYTLIAARATAAATTVPCPRPAQPAP